MQKTEKLQTYRRKLSNLSCRTKLIEGLVWDEVLRIADLKLRIIISLLFCYAFVVYYRQLQFLLLYKRKMK